MGKSEKWPEPRRIKTPDGTILHTWDGKLHNWDGPALLPQGVKRLREYYLYGIFHTEENGKGKKKKNEIEQDYLGTKIPAMRESARQGG